MKLKGFFFWGSVIEVDLPAVCWYQARSILLLTKAGPAVPLLVAAPSTIKSSETQRPLWWPETQQLLKTQANTMKHAPKEC